MARYVIQNKETTAIKKSLKKWGEVSISTDQIEGVIKIKNYRKYTWNDEVDVIFEGKLFVRMGIEKRQWRDSSILKTHRISMVKLNRLLRKCCLFEVQTRMKYFGVPIGEYYNIKSIKWQ
jgi:hypothetical protein